MSMPPDEPDRFILHRSYGNYRVLVMDEHGFYQTLLSLDGNFNWPEAARLVLDALTQADPDIMPAPTDTKQ